MFDYPLLEVLIAIEREGDFERAAKTLGVSKPFISQRLRLLEERMGGITVCRNSIKLTEFGSRLCRHYENVCLLEQQFLNKHHDLFDIEDPGPVTIKIAVGDQSLQSWFTTVLSHLHASQNRFFIDILQANPTEIEAEIKRGGVHAAITTTRQALTGFSSHALGRHTYKATATPDFIKRYFPSGVTPEALASAPSMKTSARDDLQDRWTNQAMDSSPAKHVSIVPSAHALVNKCLDGDIWSMNSSLLIDEHLATGEVVELVPGVALASDLYWHISKFLSSTLSILTASVLTAAHNQLIQPPETGRAAGC